MDRTRVRSRRAFILLGAVAGGSMLVACSGSPTASPAPRPTAPGTAPAAPRGTSPAESASKTTLTVMYAKNEFTPAYIAEFEKLHAGLTIQFIEFDQTRLNSMLAGGLPPDFVRGAGRGSANINARGLAVNLDPYIQASTVAKRDDFLDINNVWRWDGHRTGAGPYYGFTKDWSQDATLWYNRSLFDQAGVPYLSTTEPVTYTDLLEIARKLTVKKNGTTQVYGLGLEWAWSVISPVMTMILQQGGNLYTNDDLSAVDFSTPEAKKALQWYVDFVNAGVGPSVLDPLASGSDAETFMANRMAISQDGYWFGGQFPTSPPSFQDAVRMAPAPLFGSKRVSPSYAAIGAWIPAASKHKDEAWQVMEYFMFGQPAHDRAKSGWGLPALKSLLPELPQSLPYQKDAYQTEQAELKYFEVLPDSPYITSSNYDTILNQYLPQVIKKQMSLDDACREITTAANKLLQQGKERLK
jgi:multiple sugar transport system substrate-binding protein